MKKVILSAAIFLCIVPGGFTCGFNLDSFSISDLKGSDNTAIAALPVPARLVADLTRAPNLAPALDMSIRLPFPELNKRMAGLSVDMKVLDTAKPVLFRQGDHIVFTNVIINYYGIDVRPTVLIKPSFGGNNRLVIRFLKVDVDIDFGPKGMAGINKDDVMAAVVGSVTTGMLKAMDEAFAANKVRLKAKDVLSFNYDKVSWTLRAAITPDFVAPLLPGLISNVSLTAFSFDDMGFTVSVKSGSAIGKLPGYNLALSDGLLTNFLRKYAEGSDYNLAPQGRDGGVKFRADGRVEVAVKASMRDMTFKPDVYATIELTPTLTAPNTIVMRFEKVNVDQAYGIGIPDFINNMLQGKVIAGIVNGITTNKELAQTLSARKIDDRTVELKLKNSAFLPSFSNGVTVKSMKIGKGLLYLGFKF